jgi:dephospho-CoA kinase
MKVAITGGIGSGKSLVIQTLREVLPEFGFYSIDTRIRELWEVDENIDLIFKKFGTADRPTISKLAFEQPEVKKWLEWFFLTQIETWVMTIMNQREEHVIIEFPLLFELGYEKNFDFVISVSAELRTRIARVMHRDRRTKEEVMKIINSQLKQSMKNDMADFVIHNDTRFFDNTMKEVIEATVKIREKLK